MCAVSDEELPLQRVFRWERERPHAVFLAQPRGGGVREWTWAQAVDEAGRVAAWLRAQNWEPGSRVAILSRNCAWWIMADLAIWMAGHVTVPIYPSLRADSVRYILEHSDCKACFIGATDAAGTVSQGIPPGVRCIFLPTATAGAGLNWESLTTGRSLDERPTRPGREMATIIYTSGTTGLPKGVMHSFAALAADAKSLAQAIRLTPNERAFSYLPLAHIVERAGLEGTAIFLGFRISFAEGLETFVADLRRASPTLFLSVPRLLLKFQQGVFANTPKRKLEMLLHVPVLNRYVRKRVLDGLGLSSVRFAACGAAPLPPDLLLWYRNLGLELAEGYGMTEVLITHVGRPGQVRAGYVGPPVDGVEAKLGDYDELLIRSPMDMLGYYKDPQGTRDAFTPDGFFRTGDIVRIDPDGQLRIVGRLKEQFKTSKGKYVAPAPIESMLLAHPDVEACCLMGAGLPSPFAIVLLSAEGRKRSTGPEARAALEESLRTRLESVNAQLDPHERVSFIVIADGPWTVENGLITPTLKVRRNALEARYQHMVDLWNREKTSVLWETRP